MITSIKSFTLWQEQTELYWNLGTVFFFLTKRITLVWPLVSNWAEVWLWGWRTSRLTTRNRGQTPTVALLKSLRWNTGLIFRGTRYILYCYYIILYCIIYSRQLLLKNCDWNQYQNNAQYIMQFILDIFNHLM